MGMTASGPGAVAHDVRSAFADLRTRSASDDRLPPRRELRGRLLAVAIVSLVLDVVVTVSVALFGGAGLGTSFIWTTSELLTGGTSVTPGRFWPHYLELVLELWAITAIATLAGSFGSFFQRLAIESPAIPPPVDRGH